MRVLLVMCVFAVLAVGRLANADVLPNLRSTEVIEGRAVAMAGNALTINQRTVYLFGIDVPSGNAPQATAARQALDALLSNGPIRCNAIRSWFRGVLATCNASDGSDLAVTLLRVGAVVVYPSQAYATPLEATYRAAQDIARDAKVGIWEIKDSKSATAPEALDRVASALATPPDPVPINSVLWYLYPWQTAIGGVLSLASAGAAILAALHLAKAQMQSIQIQLNAEKERHQEGMRNRRIGMLYQIKRASKYAIGRCDGITNTTIKKADSFGVPTDKSINALISLRHYGGGLIVENYDAFCLAPSDFVLLGKRLSIEIENTAAIIYSYNQLAKMFDKRVNLILDIREKHKGTDKEQAINEKLELLAVNLCERLSQKSTSIAQKCRALNSMIESHFIENDAAEGGD